MQAALTLQRHCVDTKVDLSQHLELWFDDGSVVIQCESTVFRVFKGIISRQPSVLGDILSSNSLKNSYEGVPLLHTSDSAVDMYYFLNAVHDYAAYTDTSIYKPYTSLAGLLRLSTKYDVPHLKSYATIQLSQYYPTTLEEFDEREMWSWYCDPLATDLFRSTGVHELLPAALYICCSEYTFDRVLDKSAEGVEKMEQWENISVCLRSIPQLVFIQEREIMKYLRKPGPDGCLTPGVCDGARRDALLGLDDDHSICDDDDGEVCLARACRPLSVFNALRLHPQTCKVCLWDAEASIQEERKKLWERLPMLFELGTWDELLKDEKTEDTSEERECDQEAERGETVYLDAQPSWDGINDD